MKKKATPPASHLKNLAKQGKRPRSSPKSRKKRSRGKTPGKSPTPASGEVERASRPAVEVTASRGLPAGSPPRIERLLSPEEVREELQRRGADLEKAHRNAKRALERHRDGIKDGRFGEVTGLGVALRTKHGAIVSPLQYVILVSVAVKRSLDQLADLRLSPLPCDYDSVPVKVVERRPRLAAKGAPDGRVVDPLQGGAPIVKCDPSPPNHPATNWGTLGVVVPLADGTAAGLANHHFAASGDLMVQPPGNPSPPGGRRVIGTVGLSKLLNTVDCAAIQLLDSVAHLEGILGLASPGRVRFATRRLTLFDQSRRVFKFGAKTARLIEGHILHIDQEAVVRGKPMRRLFFVKGNLGEFISDGDSGSVIVMEARNAAGQPVHIVAGLAFAVEEGNNRVAFACEMAEVIKALKLTLEPAVAIQTWS